MYLSGAQELRQGSLDLPVIRRPPADVASGLSVQQIFDYLAVQIDGPVADALGSLRINWVFSDDDPTVRITLSNGTLHAVPGRHNELPDATITCSRAQLERLVSTGEGLATLVDEGQATIEGDQHRVLALWDTFTEFPLFFNIIEP